ncbi:MAG TPA: response regulator, partial [Thermoanaerobaculia bacterium]|nr:response regulator [Thermoanaerobaculia bacterium]
MAAAPPPLRAVVVDDSPLQCSAFRLLLERRYAGRVEVETYNDPAAAVERLAPDVGLLVLDWEMPGLDGAAVVE